MIGPHPFQSVGEKYLRALREAADVEPLIVPGLVPAGEIDPWLDRVDGVFLTGSHSNLEPHHYGASKGDDDFLFDPLRDQLSLAVIRAALQRRLPLFAVCRGLQEVNVVCGGTLLQRVHEQPGHFDHREDLNQPLDQQYAPAHKVRLRPGSLLALAAAKEEVEVNSLHGQGIDRLGDGLQADAWAEDGLIEAFSLAHAGQYCVAVQWHPEWKVAENPFYLALFEQFGAACRQFAANRLANSSSP
ncbi:gamma-glutamyl-gamma-aminobutyrate hydrolase family protein [Pseudoxanthomonas sp. CAU 1598]|uniref:gamma-glutamyl-gamma-aminobutyrate hydrolase n=2 Tax=Pseudomarimonas arenosa TaxID=2774145 RepID=A0AAW3ZNU4_9GAMM|nr:gamma-glutamyl-gamma-aminobutyrate hydrolase family protein [Pseudomarimonas arenosa]